MSRDQRVVEAFLGVVRRDLAAGRLRAFAEYARLFPGFEALVEREWDALAPERAPVAERPDARPAAEYVGPYRLLRELGAGGQGVIWLAEDTRLPRRVALKVLASALVASESMRQRFRREAAAVSRLDHPGIATVYEADVDGPQPFIAMRYVEGRTLAALIEQSRAPAGTESSDGARASMVHLSTTDGGGRPESPAVERPRDATQIARLFENAARALHVAHQAGLVHRDVKPGNLMVTPDGDPVLLDFGLAHQESDDAEGPRLTQTGALVGTPAYMSPEQLTGQHVVLDRRTDVYSLGVALYEALTLRLPFQAATREALYQKILAQEPPRVRKLNPRVSADLGVVVETAMSKDRDRRYQTAADLAEDLRRVQAGEPVRARPVGSFGRMARWSRRNPLVAASAGALFLVLAAGLVVTAHLLGQTRDALEETRDAQERTKTALDAARTADEAKAEALREVTTERDQSRALALAHAAASVAEDDPMLSLLFAREAASIALLPEVITQLHASVQGSNCILKLEPDRAADPTAHMVGAAYSPDGRILVTASWGDAATAAREVRIWDAEGGLLRRSPPLREAQVGIAFAPDGSRFTTRGVTGPVHVWSLEGHELASLDVKSSFSPQIAIAPDGRWLVHGGGDGRLTVWDLSGRLLAAREAHSATINDLRLTEAGDRLVSVATDGKIRVWTAPSLEPLFELSGRSFGLTAVGTLSGGRGFATVGFPGEIDVWDAGGRWLRSIAPPPGAPRWDLGQIAPDGRVVVAVALGSAWLRDFEGAEIARLRGTGVGISNVLYSADGSHITTSPPEGGRIEVFTAKGEHVCACRGFPGLGRSVGSVGPGARHLAFGAADGNVYVFAARPAEVATFQASPELIHFLDVAPRGDLVVTVDSRSGVRLHDLAGTLKADLDTRGSTVRFARFSPDGSRVLVASTDASARVFNLAGTEVASLRTSEAELPCEDAAWLPKGDGIVTLHEEGTVRLWDTAGRETERIALGLERSARRSRLFLRDDGSMRVCVGTHWYRVTGRESARSDSEAGPLTGLAVSPDGTWRVSCLGSRVFASQFMDSGGTGQALYHGHRDIAWDGHISADGSRVVTSCADGRARVFDRRGTELFALPHPTAVRTARFTADGARIVTGDAAGTVRVWLARPEDLVDLAARRTFRDFEANELGYYAQRLGRERVVEINARRCVNAASLHTLLREEVVERVRAETSLDPMTHARALELAAAFRENTTALNETAWQLVWRAGADETGAARALRHVRRAVELVPDDFNVVNTLGVAEYRAGRHEDALSTLRRCDEAHGGRQPWDTAFLAMTLARLGRADEARAAMERTRELMLVAPHRDDRDLPAAVAEAERVVGR